MINILPSDVNECGYLFLNRPEVANGFHIPMCEEILQRNFTSLAEATQDKLCSSSWLC